MPVCGSGSPRSVQPAPFDLQALGAKQHQLPAVDTPAFNATISSHGYSTGAGKSAVSVSAVGAGSVAWTSVDACSALVPGR